MSVGKFVLILQAICLVMAISNGAKTEDYYGDGISPPIGDVCTNCSICQYPCHTQPPPPEVYPSYGVPPPPSSPSAQGNCPPVPVQCCPNQPPPMPYTYYPYGNYSASSVLFGSYVVYLMLLFGFILHV